MSEVSETIIEKFIRNNSDFTKDPCDDFNEHVCPSGEYKKYYNEMRTIRTNIMQEHQNKILPSTVVNSIDNSETLFNDVVSFLKTKEALHFCELHRDFIWSISEFFQDADQNRTKCVDIISLILKAPMNSTFVAWRIKLLETFEEHVILQTFRDADLKVHSIFEKMKADIRKLFKNTPWIVSKNAVDAYIKKLDAMVFLTMGDFKKNVEKLANDYSEKVKNCTNELGSKYNDTTTKSICEFVGTAVLREDTIIYTATVGNKTKVIWDLHDNLLYQNGMIFWDQVILLASPLVIIANTTSESILVTLDLPAVKSESRLQYGTFGKVIYHEIMHGFVFSENDFVHDLRELWTDNSDCVTRQMAKTCATYNFFKCPDSNKTFEEDAADMIGYRLAWSAYKKQVTRKSFISNFDQITKDQMFFYGLAVTYCNGFAYNRDSMVHSHSAHRVNSLASSLDEFATAFECKPTDRMVQNKAGECILYGKRSALKPKKNVR